MSRCRTFFAERLPDPRLEEMRASFDVAQVRAMTLPTMVLRSLARDLAVRPALEGEAPTGVYVLACEGEPYPPALEKWKKNPGMGLNEFLRALPAKYMVATAASMTASQLGIEVRAKGPVFCLAPGRDSLSLLREQVAIDFQEGRASRALVAGASSPQDSFFQRQERTPRGFAAFVAEISQPEEIGPAFDALGALLEKTGDLDG